VVKISKGKMSTVHDPMTYLKRWVKEGAPFKPLRMMEVVNNYQRAIEKTPAWRTVSEEESTLTNERLVEFIYTTLVELPDVFYYFLHTFFVFEVLNVFESFKATKKQTLRFSMVRERINGQFAVPEAAYSVLGKKDLPLKVQKELFGAGYPAAVVFRGGIKPNIKVSRAKDIEAAVAAKALSIATRGSDRSAMSFLCRNAAYSGLSTEEVRTLRRCVAMVGGVIKSGVSQIDVEVYSVSHVAILYTSLTTHFPQAGWMLQLSTDSLMKVSQTYLPRVITDRRIGSHLVRYVPYQMKSHTLKKTEGNEELISVSMKNYHEDSVRWRPNDAYSGYTIYTTLFGYYPWASPEDEKTDQDSTATSTSVPRHADSNRSFQDRVKPLRPHFAYRFGQTESFCGMISTVEHFALWGQDVELIPKKTSVGDMHDVVFKEHMVELAHIKTESDWYRRVIESNAAMEAYWMHAKPKYSPVSNVLRIPKHGIQVEYDLLGDVVIADQGHYAELASLSRDEKVVEDQALATAGFDEQALSTVSEEGSESDNDPYQDEDENDEDEEATLDKDEQEGDATDDDREDVPEVEEKIDKKKKQTPKESDSDDEEEDRPIKKREKVLPVVPAQWGEQAVPKSRKREVAVYVPASKRKTIEDEGPPATVGVNDM